MKKLFVGLLSIFTLMLCLCLLPTRVSAETEGYYTYSVTSGEATITDVDTSISGEVVIPDTLGGYPVISIGNRAFFRCAGLTEVTIPDSVVNLGEEAFYTCSGITRVSIGRGIKEINRGAFNGCTSLTNVSIPDNVTCIGYEAFRDCTNLTSVIIGNGVSSIGVAAFEDCRNLETINIPDSVTDVGYGAFQGCSGLKNVYIGCGAKSIDSSAFTGCTAIVGFWVDPNNAYYSSDAYGVLFNSAKTKVIRAPVTLPGRYTVPGTVIEIGFSAFNGCSKLSNVSLQDGVITISGGAFSGCANLQSVNIPSSVTHINGSAFYGCTALTSVNISDIVSWCNINFEQLDGNPLYYAKRLYLNDELVTDLVIPNVTAKINNLAFVNCNEIESVTIPDSVTSIGYSAFQNCTNLVCVVLGNNIDTIGSKAFEGCTNLKDILLPDSIASIGGAAFCDCSSLAEINIPNSVHSIGDKAFENCVALSTIVIPDSVYNLGTYVFYGCKGLTSVSIGANVSKIGNYLFADCSTLTTVNIPYGVYVIGESAFRRCYMLNSVSIPESVSTIDISAFEECFQLNEITLPDSIRKIGQRAFWHCTSLVEIVFPESVEVIDDSAFSGCTNISSVTIPGKVESVGDAAFRGCSGLISLTLNEGVSSIGAQAFYDCNILAEINLPRSVTYVGYMAFYGCNNITTVRYFGMREEKSKIADSGYSEKFFEANWICGYDMPDYITYTTNGNELTITGYTGTEADVVIESSYVIDGAEYAVTAIKSPAFRNCTGISSVTIPSSIKEINGDAFYGCTGLKGVYITDLAAWCGIRFTDWSSNPLSYAENLYLCDALVKDLVIPDGITNIGNYTFYNCRRISNISIPDGTTSIGRQAFCNCDGLTSLTISDSVTTIEMSAFSSCDKLTSVTLGSGVTSVGSSAFYGCPLEYNEYKSGKYIGNAENPYYLLVQGTAWGEFTAHPDTKIIGSSAFNSGLTGIVLPDGLISISPYAFNQCKELVTVSFPDSVTSIGKNAFYCCNLTSVKLPKNISTIDDLCFNSCRDLCVVLYPGTKEEAAAISIGTGNEYLSDARWVYGPPEERTMDYTYTLNGTNMTITGFLTNASNLTIESAYTIDGKEYTVTAIGNSAFEGNTCLKGISLPDTVTSIGDKAFSECTRLTGITIPDSVTYIGKYAFWNCSGMDDPVIGSGVKIIDTGAFSYCAKIVTVTIPGSVTSIGENAFSYCEKLYRVNMGAGVTSIGAYVFDQCEWLKYINLPEGIEKIGRNTFSGCNRLEIINIPKAISSIGMYAFLNCHALKTVYFSGTEKDRSTISMDGNGYLTNATWHYQTKAVTLWGQNCTYCPECDKYYLPNGTEAYLSCEELEAVLNRTKEYDKATGLSSYDVDGNGVVEYADLVELKYQLGIGERMADPLFSGDGEDLLSLVDYALLQTAIVRGDSTRALRIDTQKGPNTATVTFASSQDFSQNKFLLIDTLWLNGVGTFSVTLRTVAGSLQSVTVVPEQAGWSTVSVCLATLPEAALQQVTGLTIELDSGYDVCFDNFCLTGVAERVDVTLFDTGEVLRFAANYPYTELPVPSKEGYEFGGWYYNVDCTGSRVSDETLVPAENHTLYAKWILDPETPVLPDTTATTSTEAEEPIDT